MRYKYRAWLKDKKEMVGVTTIDFGNGCVLIDKPYFQKIPEYYGTALLFDQIELIEYTGLKDKNGVEIYEGDIVKCEDSTYSFKIGVAEFNDTDVGSCGCCFDEFFGAGFVIKTVKTKNDDGKYFSMYDLEKCEVIGNIYANKELLENE